MKRPSFYILFATALCVVAFSNSGCKPASDGSLDLLDTKVSSLKIDDLSRSMDFLNSERRFDLSEFSSNVSASLNRWVRSAGGDAGFDDGWSLDENAQTLIDDFADLAACQRVSEMSFSSNDSFYAQQCIWLNQLASRLADSTALGPFEMYRVAADDYQPDEDPDSDDLISIVQMLNDGLDEEQAQELTEGLRIFDWITRNIQLLSDANPGDAGIEEGEEGLTQEAIREQLVINEDAPEDDLAAQGAPGLGFTRHPWQVMMYSRGDQVDRARLFILLGRQVGLNVVMLKVGEDQRPWCPALIVGDDFYLFDTELGLPVPGEKPGSIATLADVQANPDLLKRLDLTVEESLKENTTYRVTGDDLDQITAGVLIAPESVSRRFSNVEEGLGSESVITFADDVTALIDSVPATDGMSVEVWDIEFQTQRFRDVVRQAVLDSSSQMALMPKITWHIANEVYIDSFPNYRTSRCRYFKGKFNATTEKEGRGAIESFYRLMYSDAEIGRLGSDRILQRQLGILDAASKDAAAFERRVNSVQSQMRLVRRDAGFFLSQCHFDNGNIGTAGNWLERMRNTTGTERWLDGIEYLLARSYEGRGEYDKAIEELTGNEDTPQYAGNVIRARLLKELIEAE
ncbi:MAG: hypothetical protein AAF456_17905 [Planctomycetota bacterium]